MSVSAKMNTFWHVPPVPMEIFVHWLHFALTDIGTFTLFRPHLYAFTCKIGILRLLVHVHLRLAGGRHRARDVQQAAVRLNGVNVLDAGRPSPRSNRLQTRAAVHRSSAVSDHNNFTGIRELDVQASAKLVDGSELGAGSGISAISMNVKHERPVQAACDSKPVPIGTEPNTARLPKCEWAA